MSSKNLWGDVTSVAPVRTATTILKEQATALMEMTKGTLRGKVNVSTNAEGGFEILLCIIAPAINNYKFEVVFIEHGIELYPAKVVAAWDRFISGKEVKCKNEDELTNALGRILGSDQVTRVITSLVSQSKAMKEMH
jgi:hypothetical protein